MDYSIEFETFVDVRGDVFADYFSKVIGKVRKRNPAYCEAEKKIAALYEQYPKVMAVLDTEKAGDLTEAECGALLEILTLQSKITVMQQEAIYLRGCYDGVGYLKKAGIL